MVFDRLSGHSQTIVFSLCERPPSSFPLPFSVDILIACARRRCASGPLLAIACRKLILNAHQMRFFGLVAQVLERTLSLEVGLQLVPATTVRRLYDRLSLGRQAHSGERELCNLSPSVFVPIGSPPSLQSWRG